MAWLKNIFICIFLAGITFPSELVHLVSFVPEFIEHYQHHNEEHHQLSFTDFILEHLNGAHDETEAQHEQDQCPLSHDHVVTSVTLFVSKPSLPFELDDNNFPLDERLSSFPANEFCTSEYSSVIWQPPKIS